MGKESRDEGWFNLKFQGFQPSTPSHAGHFTHYYEDAFNGGSCLSVESNEVIKLFTSELATEGGIIFSYTFKREHQRNDLEIYMNVLNTNENRERQIVCTRATEENGNKIYPLHHDAVRSINIHLANNNHMAIPTTINNWVTRYYILKFPRHTIISDIGVKKIHSGKVLLGQISLYSAKNFEHELMNEIKTIEV